MAIWQAKQWDSKRREFGIETISLHPATGKPVHIAGGVAAEHAPLIAAAPEMLLALKEIVDDAAMIPHSHDWVIETKRLIARATGQC